MKTVLSAVQPSNNLTLGNYLGALRGWVDMQADPNNDCLFCAVDLHAITVRQDPKLLRDQTYTALATYLAAGIDPEKSIVFVQSHVPEHAELSWVLTCYAGMGELSRMTQFKDKTSKLAAEESIGAGLFAYPLLMAADILLYRTHYVPIGEDQKQHIELAQDLAQRVNRHIGDVFVVPVPVVPKIGARIMSLQDPTKKMSKSDPDTHAAVFLLDSDDVIAKKIKRAVTDSGSEVTGDESRLGVRNLLQINAAVTGRTIEQVVEHFAGRQYGHLKVETADAVVACVGPVRQRTQGYLDDRSYLDAVVEAGCVRARVRAQRTLRTVYDKLGFVRRGTSL